MVTEWNTSKYEICPVDKKNGTIGWLENSLDLTPLIL